ncbi:hypothetical protein [Mycobacterium sp. 1423905.2]|uniref:hypothetical protein n=1 Tax=Mycobacterium sp. 1423905.2 TaxID=1856859 RepID=UPI0007FFC174|nr:hypothetical protein [Mycobacterium sp. 1423905.2]OBJ52923.1 hypothetical protein A9W95_19280 [Mycobacterium sp. 1423905.2]
MASGSSLPPHGFRWVEHDDQSEAPPRQSRRRWWWVAAAALGVIAVVAGGIVAALWERSDTTRHGAYAPSAPPPIGTPKDLLVSIPLSRQPVPGWRLSAKDIGLPPGVKVGNLFARVGKKAYFVTVEGCDRKCQKPTGWVYGLDADTGAKLFSPLALPGFSGTDADCHSNGPAVAICTSRVFGETDDAPPPGAWVIDLDRGVVTYHGPNTLNPNLKDVGGMRLEVVGYEYGPAYLVAAKRGDGIHGIGPHAELTWFLPGSGELRAPALYDPDVPSLTLAVQPSTPSDDRRGDRVFSVVDGRDLTPHPPSGTRLEEVEIYNGGFAYQFDAGKVTGTLMYDTAGHQVGRQEPERSYPRPNAAMLTLVVGDHFQIYDAAGKPIATIPSRGLVDDFKTIGTKLYVRTQGSDYGVEQGWQQWDLLTAQPGSTCTMNLGPNYVGSDGIVVMTMGGAGDQPNVSAIDTTTCRTLWEMPGKIRIHKVSTGLIEIDHEHDAVMSLRPSN